MMTRISLFAFLFALQCGARAQNSVQSWWSLSAETNLSKKWSMELTEQVRLSHDPMALRGSYSSMELSYKLGNGWRLLGNFRYSTSSRFDRLRYGAGIQKRIELGKAIKGELRLRALYQYQHHWLSLPEYGINPPIQNFRFMARYDFRIAKKTRMNVFVEPLWRHEAGALFFHRYRAGIAVERELPGPFSLSAGYTLQQVFSNPSLTHISRLGVNYTFKRKKMEKSTKPEKTN